MAKAAVAEKPAATAILDRAFAPIDKFVIAIENPRAHREIENVDELAANMAAHGQLQDVIAYAEKGKLHITAGRRRFSAAKKAGLDKLAYFQLEKNEAIRAGMAEQEGHVAMHPADQAKAWAAMLQKGEKTAAIANAFGVKERTVLQRVALANLHPPILAALAADQIDLDQAGAWANIPIDRQPSLWKRIGKNAGGHYIRNSFSKETVTGSDSVAKFIGEAAYLAAGGHIEPELFGVDGDPPRKIWSDRDIVDKLKGEKLDAAVAAAEKEGWGEVFVGEVNYSTHDYHWDRPKSKADRERLTLRLSVSRDGKIERTLLISRKAAKGKKASKGKTKSAPKGKQPPMTNGAHESISRAAGGILARRMVAKPEIALTCICAHLARRRWDKSDGYDYGTPSSILTLDVAHYRRPKNSHKPTPPLADDAEAKEMDMRWRKAIGPLADAEATIAAFPPKAQMDLLAFLVGGFIDIAEFHTKGGSRPRRVRVSALLAKDTPDPAAYFTPSADLLKSFSVPTLEKICKELSIEPGKTKGKTAEAIAIAAKEKHWVPSLLVDILGIAPPATGRIAKAISKSARAKK